MIYLFEDYALDPDRRELRRGTALVALEPQVFDLLHYLIRSRERVVSKDDMIASVWQGRIVSESALTSRLTAARQAVGDSGDEQRLIRTFPRKGHRFIGAVREERQVPEPPAAGQTPPASRAAVDSAERRQLTIMACDILGPAALARLDPEDLRQVMATRAACAREVLASHGGVVAANSVDGLLVHFGHPQAHEDDAERAVRAALALTRALADLDVAPLISPPQPRIGIATGLVVVGGAGGMPGSVMEHGVAGDTPHLAARLCNVADPGAIVISAGTRALIGGLFDCADLGRIALQGAADPVAAFRVVRESAVASRFDALRPRRTALVGRDEELALLLRRWAQAKSGEGRVVLIWGEPGIGKSRLVAALEDAIREEPCAALPFSCSPHRAETALYPVASHVERAAGFAADDDSSSKQDKLSRMLAPFSADIARDMALYTGLLAIGGERPPEALPLSPQRRKELLFETFLARLAAIAAQRPALVVLEDAHWIDPTTRDLFDLVIEHVRGLRVLLVMTYRPEFAPPWIGQSHVTTLTLNRLGRRDNAVMIRHVAGDRELPAVLAEQIIAHTDGVPLFIEEVTKSVLESGLLRAEDGAYVLAGPLPTLAVPTSLRASLTARIDRLAARAVVQAGAALGREFAYPVLKSVMKLGDDALAPLLDQLVASELVHQRGAIPYAAYTFKHALVQDAAHESLLKRQRVDLHARIVEVLEQEFVEVPRRNPDVLAYHCSEAGLRDKAIGYWLTAARMALDRSAGIEAQAQVERALALVRDIAHGPARERLEGRLQVALADTLVMTRGFAAPEVATALSRARTLLDAAAQPAESLRALGGLCQYHLMRSESPRGLMLASPLLERTLDGPAATIVRYLVGAAELHVGNVQDAMRHLEEALPFYDEEACRPFAFVGGPHVYSFTLIWLGLARLYAGFPERGKETMLEAVRDARRRSHPFTLVSALLALSRFLIHEGDVRAAIDATEEGHAIATEQRSPYHISRANVLRAVNLIESGDPRSGIALMHRALDAHRATGANYQSSFNLSYLALAHSRAEDHQRALAVATAAVAEVERTGERWWEAEAHRIRGEIIRAATPASSAEADDCFREARSCARRQGARFWEQRAAESLVRR